MKKLLFVLFLIGTFYAKAQVENIIIVTTDGFRWQEVFKGMDSAIAVQWKYNKGDSAYIFKKYWDDNVEERRKKLFPFIWGTMAAKGQVYGNRTLGNNVNVFNPYWFSYPGYSELMCGYVDTAIHSNLYKPNPNTNLLDYLNQQPKFKNRVAAFGAWNAFERILNQAKSKFPVVNAFDSCGNGKPNANEKLINDMLKNSIQRFGVEECYDVFTHFEAMEYLKNKHPKVLYIAYGETDEWAHDEKYKTYLDAAHQVDNWLQQLWEYIQSSPQYKNKTALLITVDHGRGDYKKDEWTSHDFRIKGSDQIWFAVMAPNIKPLGEMKTQTQLYQRQIAQTIAHVLGTHFVAEHPVADAIETVIK